ncbi:MAG: shikimate dehydrogenase [Hyphomonadaceae bacterium]|nr:shikimate dehydrogenase [Hyphomonadaceae bacterium]
MARSGRTIRAGLVGAGIQRSLSPFLHVTEARAHGLDYTYDLFDLDLIPHTDARLECVLDRAAAEGFSGLNITHPSKQAVIPLLDSLSADAAALGAVNTVVFEGSRKIGHNTDWYGFSKSRERGLPDAKLHHVILLGAGGAGAAVAYALLRDGADCVTVFDVDADRSTAMVAQLGGVFGSSRIEAGTDMDAALRRADGLVNCTPVGMLKYPGIPLPPSVLHSGLWVADIVYVPLRTELIAAATALGCPTLMGGGMTVFQAAEAFRLFTGVAPDAERMLLAFDQRVKVDLAA